MMAAMRLRRIASWVGAGLTVAGVAFAGLLNALAGAHGEDAWTGLAWAAAALASSGVGLVLAASPRRQPDRVAAAGERAGADAAQVATPYADYAALEKPGALPGAEWAVLVHERAWPTLFACITAIALVFPDGRLPSSRWRPVAIVAGGFVRRSDRGSLLAAERYSDAVRRRSPARSPSSPKRSSGSRSPSAASGALAGLVAAALALRTG